MCAPFLARPRAPAPRVLALAAPRDPASARPRAPRARPSRGPALPASRLRASALGPASHPSGVHAPALTVSPPAGHAGVPSSSNKLDCAGSTRSAACARAGVDLG